MSALLDLGLQNLRNEKKINPRLELIRESYLLTQELMSSVDLVVP